MILTTLGIIAGLYVYTRKVIQNEPLKSIFSDFYVNVNTELLLYQKRDVSITLNLLLKLSYKVMFYIFIGVICTQLLPDKITKNFLVFLTSMFLMFSFTVFSIEWMQYHRKLITKHLLSPLSLGLLFMPTLIYVIFNIKIYESLLLTLIPSFSSIYTELLFFQFCWLVIALTVFYIGSTLIALPIYFLFYSIIFLTASIIRFMDKHIDRNLLDGIVGTISIIVVIAKAFV